MCFKDGIQIIGGASKLITNAIEEIGGNIVTWSDNRWSTGKLYDNVGFKLDANLNQDYSYVDISKGIRYSKQSQQKKLTKCPDDLTEHQWANQRNLYKIFDCGKKRWIIDKNGN